MEFVIEGHPELVKKPLVRAQYSGNDVVFDSKNPDNQEKTVASS